MALEVPSVLQDAWRIAPCLRALAATHVRIWTSELIAIDACDLPIQAAARVLIFVFPAFAAVVLRNTLHCQNEHNQHDEQQAALRHCHFARSDEGASCRPDDKVV
eukprot:TRINITY_DN99680_c0_g1_i1.p1 TRINITY_DN99680_c0_g1~~TRINITY_DN99680_c0_g1_i1.p1  ORF type:complete len:105 (-),score=17.56 TRINITY_DN99680_c0_g1_i1:27-341(-)